MGVERAEHVVADEVNRDAQERTDQGRARVGVGHFCVKGLDTKTIALRQVTLHYRQEEAAVNTAATIEAPGMRIQFLIEGHQTNDAISIFRCHFEAGARSPMPHSHDGFDETIYGLSGEVTMVVDGVPHEIGAGDVIHVPRGVVHGFGVKEAAAILAISTPGLFGYPYFREMADALNAAGDGPPDRELLIAIQKRHGLTPALPAS
jgi:quercetin dioxygenase-like cupin family protein